VGARAGQFNPASVANVPKLPPADASLQDAIDPILNLLRPRQPSLCKEEAFVEPAVAFRTCLKAHMHAHVLVGPRRLPAFGSGVGRVVLSNRERRIIVAPMDRGLRALTLRYTHAVHSELELFAGIAELILPKEMLGVAERILDAMKADFDPADLEDRYRTALSSMLRGKQPQAPTRPASAAPSRETSSVSWLY
jgi:hypothetical protein